MTLSNPLLNLDMKSLMNQLIHVTDLAFFSLECTWLKEFQKRPVCNKYYIYIIIRQA